MLSTVMAAQGQFRVDTAERDRERAILAAIRERRAAVAQAAIRPAATRLPVAWPRPIASHAAYSPA